MVFFFRNLTHRSIILIKMTKLIFAIDMTKFTNYSSMKNYHVDFGLDPYLIFISYLAFRHSSLSKVGCI